MFYFFIYIILFYLSIFEFAQQKPINNRILLLSIGLLCLVSGLRYETGVDWHVYNQYYLHVVPINEVLKGNYAYFKLGNFEIGFNVLLSITKWLGLGIQGVFFIVSFFNSCLLYNSLKRYTVMPAMGVLLYFVLIFFVYDMSGIRQAIAINLFFYSLRYIEARNGRKYFLCILLAFCFHLSAIVLFPFYFFINKKFNIKILNIIFIAGLVIYLFQIKWVYILLFNVANFFPEGLLFKKILFYVSSTVFSGSRSFSLGFFLNIFLYILFVYNRKNMFEIKYFNLFFNIFVVNTLVFTYLFEIADMSIRYRAYFLMADTVAFSYFIYAFKKENNRIIAMVCILSYCFYLGRIFFLEDDEAIAYNPYQNGIIYEVFQLKSTGNERLQIHNFNYTHKNANQ